METSSENSQAMERFKEQVHHHYKELVNEQFDDCTKKVLPEQMRAVMKGTPHN